ncbi:MAG: O-antigen ligase family protein [Pseudomonadota bacterium]|nr:O-antigen ligase family protein [Pseudomonadota bacterium]
MSLMFKIERQFSNPASFLLVPVLLSPLSWFLGLNLIFYHLIAFFIFLSVYGKKGQKHIPLVLVFLGLYSAVYLGSIILVVPGEEFSRILASLYNWSYWLMGCMLIYSVVNAREDLDFTSVYHGVSKIILGLGALAFILYLGAGIIQELRVPSLLGLFLPLGALPPLISDSFSLNLLGVDWFAGDSTPRMSLLAPYPTAFAMAIIGLLIFSFTKRISLVLVLVCGFMVYMSLSRMVMVFYLVSLLLVAFISLESSLRRMVSVFGITLLLLFLPYVAPSMFLAWDEFNAVRQASSDMRMYLYQLSIDTALEERPVIGMGVKSRGELLIPLGSHSTLVGAFYKTGFLGFLLLFCFYFLSLVMAVFSIVYARRDVAYIGGLVVLFSVFSIFEDMDAPQLVSYMFFLCVGFLCRFVKFRLSQ